MSEPEGTITIQCIYCGHTWTESIAELEKQERVIYRRGRDDNAPARATEYRVQCPHCGRRMVVTVRVRGV